MKKSIKILALILTLALVCGVFVIGAFAADATNGVGYDYANREAVQGETVISYMDYEKYSAQSFGLANSMAADISDTTTSGKGFQIIYKDRQGEVSIVKAAKGGSNTYLKIDMTQESFAQKDKGPYVSLRLQNDAPNVSALTDAHWSMKEVSYLVFDTDVYFPTTLTGNPNVNFQFRGYDENGTRQFTQEVGIDTNSVNWPFKDNYTVNGAAFSSTGWNHITGIVECILSTNEQGDYITLNVYTVVNGVLSGEVKKFSNASADPSDSHNSDRTFIYPFEARLQFGNATDGTQFLVDNTAVRKFDRTYDGNLAELLAAGNGTDMTAWDANVYDVDLLPYGQTVATREVDGEIVEYDRLQKAIDEAEEEEVITLTNNVSGKVYVDKPITIDGTDAGFTCDIATEEGFSSRKEDNIYYVETATEGLTVIWYPCDCGNDCYEEAEFVVYEGNNIYEAYKNAVGYYPACTGYEDAVTHTKKTLKGYADISGIIENFTETTVVTADMVGETVEIEPVYETATPVGMKITKSTGAETYYYDVASFLSMFTGVGNNNTIKLLSNIEIGKNIGFNHNVTLDLNGYRITSLQLGSTAKYNLFSAKGKVLNVCSTSETSVGTIYHAKQSGTSWVGDPVFAAGGNGTVNINGADADGNTTVRIYTAVLFNDWSGVTNYNIDGGEYYRTASDHTGLVYARGTGTGTFKNAYIYSMNAVFSFCGVNTATTAAGKTGVYTVDNCVIDAATISVHAYSGLSVTFTNCYLNGDINPSTTLNATVAPATETTHFIGDGCFIKAGATMTNVGYTGTTYSVNVMEKVVSYKNDFNAADRFAYTASETVVTYDRMIAPEGLKEIEVIWVDTEGNELGRSKALPGLEAAAPATPVAETNGMVMAAYSDWVGGTVVPLTAEDGYTIKLAENSGVTYVAGTVDVLFNFDMVGHYQYNFYVPAAPEGVTYTGAIRATNASIAVPAPSVTGPDGTRYSIINAWPSAHNTDADYGFKLTYTWNGQSFEYIAPSINMAKYVNYIFTSGKYDEYEEVLTMFADMIRVIEQANIAAKQETDAAFDAVYASVESYMSSVDNVIDPEATNDFSSVSQYLEEVKIVYQSGLGAVTPAITAKDGYYGLVSGKQLVHGVAAIGDNREINNGGVVYGHNVRAYALSEVLVITFYAEEDIDKSHSQIRKAVEGATPVATVEFTIAGLVNDGADTLDAATKALLESFFAYSYSSSTYMDWRSENLHKR